jgi:CubicO group peptidase (beta-lactamase class C family)
VPGEPGTFTLEEYLTKFCTTGFLVLKDDQIVFERYLQGRKATDGLFSASMSKTVLALLIGIAVGEGRLTLNDRVATVLPDFKDSAFADSTLEDMLRMSSGVALTESHETGADSDNRAINPMISPRQNVREYLKRKKDRSAATGTVFSYKSAQTALLGAVMAQRIGTSLTSYLEHKLWIPMGAESKSYWIKNFHGEEGVQGQFIATLRDYARLGYLVANQGRINGKEIVPTDWIVKMTELRRDKPQPANPPFYGLHVWIPQAAGGRSLFWGVNGQNIFVDPVAQVVIVHTGNSPKAVFDGNRHLFPLRDAIVRSLATER